MCRGRVVWHGPNGTYLSLLLFFALAPHTLQLALQLRVFVIVALFLAVLFLVGAVVGINIPCLL